MDVALRVFFWVTLLAYLAITFGPAEATESIRVGLGLAALAGLAALLVSRYIRLGRAAKESGSQAFT